MSDDGSRGPSVGALPSGAFAALVRRASGVVWLLDARGRVRFVGDSVVRELGLAPDHAIGRPFETWLDPSQRGVWHDALAEAVAHAGAPVRRELRVTRVDGRSTWTSAVLQDLRDDPDVGSLFLNLRDVSELVESRTLAQRQSAALARSEEVRDRLLAMVEDALVRRASGIEARLLEHAVEMIPGAEAGSVLVRDDDDRLRYRAAVGYDLDALGAIDFAIDELSEALRGHAPQVVRYRLRGDVGDRRDVLEASGRRSEIASTLAVPVTLHGRLRGVLNLDAFVEGAAFDDDALTLASVFASHLALVLERDELEARAERSRRYQRLLADAQRLLLEAPRLEAFLPAFAKLILDGDPATIRVGVFRVDDDGRLVPRLYGPDDPDLAERLAGVDLGPLLEAGADSVLTRTLATRRTTYLPDVRAAPGWIDLGDAVIRSALIVPVVVDDVPWGVFDLVSDRLDGFDSELRELIEQVSTGLALALERDAARRDLEQRMSKLRAVVDASRHLHDASSEAEAFRRATEAVRRRVSAAYATVMRPDAEGGFAHVALDRDPDDAGADGPIRRIGRADAVWRAAATVSVDLGEDEAPDCAFVGTPIVGSDGAPFAVLAAVIRAPARFGEADVAFLEAVAQAVASALDRLGLLRRAEREAEAYRALARFGASIEEINDPERLIELGARELSRQLELPYAHLHERRGDRWRLRRSWGDVPAPLLSLWRGEGIPADAGLLGHAARTRRVAYLDDYAAWSGRLPDTIGGIRTVVALPITRGGAVDAILAFHDGRRRPLPAERLTIARNFLRRLEHALERADNLAEVEATREATLRALGLMLEHRDFETKGHTDRVVALADRFAVAVDLDTDARLALRWGAYLHDVGKVAVPDRILLKPGRLNEDEFAVIRRHTLVGADVTDDIGFLPPATREVVRSHHERWDGGGYPDGLAGEAIPRLARMFTLVDVWDALVSERPYKAAWSPATARAELVAAAGRQFDPELVTRFLPLTEGEDA